MKKITTNTLTTPHYEEALCDTPWNVYPRPQLKRDSFICLNGLWDFAITREDGKPRKFDEQIRVPFPPESKLSGVEKTPEKYDFLHYCRTFELPEGFLKDRLLLRFGAIDRLATVAINGNVIGSHNNGYLPFFADVTD